MSVSRREFLVSVAAAGAAGWRCGGAAPEADDGVTRLARFEHGGAVHHGIVQGDNIQPIEGDFFGSRTPAGEPIPMADVKLLYPVEPTKIMALAGNYSDHLAADAPLPERPEPFYKTTNSIISPGANVVLPPDSRDVHYEAEFVIVNRQEGQERLRDRSRGLHPGLHLRQRHLRTPVAKRLARRPRDQGPAVVARQGRGDVFARRPRYRCRPELPGVRHPPAPKRRDQAGDDPRPPDLQTRRDGRVHLEVRHADAGRPDLHRHHRQDAADPVRRRTRGRDRRHRRVAESGRVAATRQRAGKPSPASRIHQLSRTGCSGPAPGSGGRGR